MNGTIQSVALNSKGKNLRQKLVSDKNGLIAIFEEMFGSNKAPMFETSGPGSIGSIGTTHPASQEALIQLLPRPAIGVHSSINNNMLKQIGNSHPSNISSE